MSENTTEAAETDAEATTTEETAEQKPTDTVDFWKQKAREQEKRAKDNASAAKELAEIRESQKSQAEKDAERVTKAEAEVATVPAKVATALKEHLSALHEFDPEDVELFLTATEPELLLKQVTRLLGQSDKRNRTNHVAREGSNHAASSDDEATFARDFFSG